MKNRQVDVSQAKPDGKVNVVRPGNADVLVRQQG